MAQMTTQAQHTPGPWHVVPIGDGQAMPKMNEAKHWNIYNHNAFVCQVKREGKREIQQADVRLISLAPEMLEALEHVLDICKDHHIDNGFRLDLIDATVRTIISRAKGVK